MKKLSVFTLILGFTFIFTQLPVSFKVNPGIVFAEEITAEAQAVMVNINTASVEQLSSLKGIGEKTAQAIVEYRKTNGLFKSIEDIKNVKGIGEKKFEEIKGLITIK